LLFERSAVLVVVQQLSLHLGRYKPLAVAPVAEAKPLDAVY